MEFKILTEHAQQVLFQAHHERVHPGVKNDIGALKTHLRCIACREILHVNRCRNHCTRDAVSLGNMALHLRAQNQLGLQTLDLGFDFQIVVADQRFYAIGFGAVSDIPSEFAAVGAHANDFKAHFFAGNPGGRDHMCGIAKQVNAFAGKVSRVHRLGVPAGTCGHFFSSRERHTGQAANFSNEVLGGFQAQRHGLGVRLLVLALEPLRCAQCNFGIEHHIEVGLGEFFNIGNTGF